MERAGQAVFNAIRQYFAETRNLLVLCGSGNNGGDGFVVARLAKQAGYTVVLHSFADPHKAGEDAKLARQKWLNSGGEINIDIPVDFQSCDLIIDALLGTGIKGTVREPYQSLIGQINQSPRPVLSIDIPSGLDADCGMVNQYVIEASVTVTLVGLKAGLLTGEGKQQCGILVLDELGIATEFAQLAESSGMHYALDNVAPLPKRPINSHKGHFGRLLCIGGHSSMPGAIRLSANAALRCGAGLIKVVCHPESRLLVHSGLPELMLGQEDVELDDMLDWADAIIIGPGLSQYSWGESLFEQVIRYQQNQAKPWVIDADGLNLLTKYNIQLGEHCVLTPHPGEASRLLGCTVSDIESNRISSARTLAQKYRCQVNLKGAGSVIVTDNQLAICKEGNPGMASAGMGDTLTGIIGALMAQGLSASDALLHASALHARAGDLAAQNGGEHGMLASDLILFLRQLVNR